VLVLRSRRCIEADQIEDENENEDEDEQEEIVPGLVLPFVPEEVARNQARG
jgi:hypothetical protein